jgi:hypothetical protein
MLTTVLNVRDCKFCGNSFLQLRPMQAVCSPICATKLVRRQKAEKTNEKVRDRARLRELDPIRKHRARAQDAFNKFIRERDFDQPCISCGERNPPVLPGGQWDAGHFLGRGAYPELAFEEDNCHKQCKSCNAGGGKFAHKAKTVNAKYEEAILVRIGPDRVAALRVPRPAKKYTRDDYAQITKTYNAKTRELRKART